MPGRKANSKAHATTAKQTAQVPGATQASRAESAHLREVGLVLRVRAHCHVYLAEACRYSSLPLAFLAALVANESGGYGNAKRFEPAVYRHLKSLAAGQRSTYSGHDRVSLQSEIAEMLHPKSAAYHAPFLNALGESQASDLAARQDEALRELATSWGYTQIMGYHLVGRPGTVLDLLEPRFHFRFALELLADFAERYQLDVRREFAEMFRCWNTGAPYGITFDPAYVDKGLKRMEIYRGLSD
jgi:hypothetical protein